MSLGFRKFISEMFMNGKFPKISRYTVASQSIVWYLLREITDIDTSNYHRYRHRYRYRYWYRSISSYITVQVASGTPLYSYDEYHFVAEYSQIHALCISLIHLIFSANKLNIKVREC